MGEWVIEPATVEALPEILQIEEACFSAPWTQSGVFKHRFTKTGTYRLFCSLHPAKMVQQITVR